MTATPLRSVEPGSQTVKLGGHTYTVVPQRVGRLKKRLGRQLSSLAAMSEGNLLDAGLERAYGVLEVFIPDIMPLHEFLGFPSQSVMEDPEGEEADDLGVTWPEVTGAFKVVMEVNDFDLVKHLGKFISPELIRAYVTNALMDTMLPDGTTTDSASSSSTATDPSPSTTSGTTPQISESSAA